MVDLYFFWELNGGPQYEETKCRDHVPLRRNDQAALAFNHVTRKTNACDCGKSQQCDKWSPKIEEEKWVITSHKLIRNSIIGTLVLSSLKQCQASCESWHIEIILGNNHGNPSRLDFKDFENLPNGSWTISVVVTDQLLQANGPESNTHFSILYAHPITQNRLNYKWFKIVKI